MRELVAPLQFLQLFFLPGLIVLLAWAIWRTVFHKDEGIGLAVYLGLVIVVDGFLNTGIFIPGLDKGSIRYSEVCAAFLLLNRPAQIPRTSPYTMVRWMVWAYFALLFLSALRAEPIMSGLLEFRMRVVPQIVAFTLVLRGLRSPESFRRFMFGMMALTIIIGAFVFWDVFFDHWLLKSDMLFKAEYGANRKNGRFGGFFLNPNYLGAYTVLLFPGVFVWAANARSRLSQIFSAVTLLCLVFCLVETQSRAPVIGFMGILPLLLLGPAGEVTRRRRIATFLPGLALVMLLMPGFYDHASDRFSTISNELSTDEGRSRQTTWQYAQQMVADHPFVGIGFGEAQFVRAMTQYGFGDTYEGESLDNPHNSYLQMAVYAGVPTLFAFLVANFFLLAKTGSFLLRRQAHAQTHAAFGLAVGVLGFLATIYPDMHMFTQTVAPVYWMYFGLLLSLVSAEPAASVEEAVRTASEAEPFFGETPEQSPAFSAIASKSRRDADLIDASQERTRRAWAEAPRG